MNDIKSVYQNGICDNFELSEKIGEEICITGIAGRYPKSDSVFELQENLFNKVDMLTADDSRWKITDFPEIPKRSGKINKIDKFDAAFFGVHYKQAQVMDPQSRILHEKTYEAIVDAGVNPRALRNTNTGVFIGSIMSESQLSWMLNGTLADGFAISGCNMSMFANRISYWLGVTGPSFTTDSACSSALTALHHAFYALKDGRCTAAIVGGTNLCLIPNTTQQYNSLGVLSRDGRCKTFDLNADGFVRSDAISVIFLQKAKDAKRIYAQIVDVGINCDGYKPEGISFPSSQHQEILMKSIYINRNINPNQVEYVEPHGTGTKIGDPEEINAIDRVFCTNRKDPLKVGAIKTNVGHAEGASGMNSLIKLCIAYNTGYLAPTLNFKEPNTKMEGLVKGKISVITEKTAWNRGISAITALGIGGANAHVVMKKLEKKRGNKLQEINDALPRLVCSSGRTESAVNCILNDVESRSINNEFIALLHGIQEYDIPGHVYRGYTLLKNVEEPSYVSREIQFYSGAKRPVWFVFSGMGSQWSGCGVQLLKLPLFATTIDKCHKVLQTKGLNLIRILTDPDPKIYENILHSFVAITAVQLALCDLLKAIGIEPDHIIGHSMGETGCGYADGSLTLEEAILGSYYRGIVSIETPLTQGAMAAIGLGYQQIKDKLPKDIEVACHNASDSCTLSGPFESINKYVIQLKNEGTFAKQVQVSNIAYHSSYVKDAGPILLKHLKNIMQKPILRSSKWISTSVPEHLSNEIDARYASPEYYTNNLLNPVLFEEGAKRIPANAIIIEIAPHGLMGAILKRSHKECTNIALMNKAHSNNLEYLLIAIGKLFEAGLNPKISDLYPKVQFPVSLGTPMISHLIEWDHNEDWYVYKFNPNTNSGERTIKLDVNAAKWKFLTGHIIDGRNLFPAAGYLFLVWETFALMKGKNYESMSIVFDNVKLIRATNVPKKGIVEFFVVIQRGSGNFEILEDDTVVVTGNITEKSIDFKKIPTAKKDEVNLSTKDVYKELKLRGYQHKDMFSGIRWSNIDGTLAFVEWRNNWITFLDTILQLKVFKENTRNLLVPTRIERVCIDPLKHSKVIVKDENENVDFCYVKACHEMNTIGTDSVEIYGIHVTEISRKKELATPTLERYAFLPNYNKQVLHNLCDAVCLNLQIILENISCNKIKCLELKDFESVPLTSMISDTFDTIIYTKPNLCWEFLIHGDTLSDEESKTVAKVDDLHNLKNLNLVIGTNILTKNNTVLNEISLDSFDNEAFIISRENEENISNEYHDKFNIIAITKCENETLVLLKKRISHQSTSYIRIEESEAFEWIKEVKTAIQECDRVILVSENETQDGLLGLVNCIRKEPLGNVVRCVIISDAHAPIFNVHDQFYEKQLEKDLVVNIYKDGEWGTYRHLPLEQLNESPSEHAYLNIFQRGDLSTLHWAEGPLKIDSSKDLVHVYYSALNFRDIVAATARVSLNMIVQNRINEQCFIGFEYSGKLSSGERVMGLVNCRGISNLVKPVECAMWPVPPHWSLEEAVTIPGAYLTVYYALMYIGGLTKGQSVLIHAGTGGVGQAAINVCLSYGCKIFTTVGTPKKRIFLKKLFPQIPDKCIGNTRDTSFEQMVMLETNGRGVDFVLNSLADDKLQASIRCLAPAGRFLEIGKFDVENNSYIGMKILSKETSIHGLMVDMLVENRPHIAQRVSQLIYEGIQSGCVKPISRMIYDSSKIKDAFKLMAASKHVGKIVIKMREDDSNINTTPKPYSIVAVPRYVCETAASYVLIGGLGGFGLELLDWLVLKGAKKIVINSRRGITNGYQAYRIKISRSMGAEVIINTEDVTTSGGCERLLKFASSLGPVKAIFNLALVLKDKLFENQTEAEFKEVFGPKAIASKHLDIASRKLCPQIENFVMFSSLACGNGNLGQTNYGMANCVMEKLCEKRKNENLPALAIQWGAIGNVGIFADTHEENQNIMGLSQQSISNCLTVLDQLLKQKKYPILRSLVVADRKTEKEEKVESLVKTISSIMNIKNPEFISQEITLADLGMDSIISSEIKQCLERDFNMFLTPSEIRKLTFFKLNQLSNERHLHPISTKTVPNWMEREELRYILRSIGDEQNYQKSSFVMKTKFCDDNSNESKPKHVFMIPGIEGEAKIYESMCENLECKATALQPGNQVESIEKTAKRLINTIESRILEDKRFIIIGYSYGAVVAVELAKCLEDKGYKGTLFLIDGSGKYISDFLNNTLKKVSKNELQDFVLFQCINIFQIKITSDITAKITKATSLNNKIEVLYQLLNNNVSVSKTYMEHVVVNLIGRIEALKVYEYKHKTKLRSKIILMKAKESMLGVEIDNTYSLQTNAENVIEIHDIDGDHNTILKSPKCSDIINQVIHKLSNI